MTITMIAGLALFAFVSTITPGPNNMMLMASGANFGLPRTTPHMLGVSLGFAFLMLMVGVGLAGLVAVFPWILTVLRWAGAAYLLYLAFKVATATGFGSNNGTGRPMTFWQAVAFQWINPKAFASAMVAVTTYAMPDNLLAGVLLVVAVFTLIGAPCILTWAAFGMAMKRILTRPIALRAFNIVMALLLVASIAPMLTEGAKGSSQFPQHHAAIDDPPQGRGHG
jgi:threonine/homoserine/homoserine lactone efflux protein